jgi:hypothetical protein
MDSVRSTEQCERYSVDELLNNEPRAHSVQAADLVEFILHCCETCKNVTRFPYGVKFRPFLFFSGDHNGMRRTKVCSLHSLDNSRCKRVWRHSRGRYYTVSDILLEKEPSFCQAMEFVPGTGFSAYSSSQYFSDELLPTTGTLCNYE